MPCSRSAAPSRGARTRRITTSLLAGAALAAGGAAALAPATASAAPVKVAATHRTAAPVLDGAAKGGAVIIWMKQQNSGLNLRTHGKKRMGEDFLDQRPVVKSIKAHGGTDILRLVSVSAVAAHVSAAEVTRLSHLAGVKQIVPDSTVKIGDPLKTGPTVSKNAKITSDTVAKAAAKANAKPNAVPAANPFPTVNNCGTQAAPLIEPEALGDIHAPAMTDNGLSTEPGNGIVVGNAGISASANGDLVGNPNFVRPAGDGGGSVVVGATPGDTTDSTDGEYYGDASSIDAQGGVEYQYANELPYSGLPTTCYFKLEGDAPGASLVDTKKIDTPPSSDVNTNPNVESESAIVAGIDAAVVVYHANVINESYGYSNTPGAYATHYAANDAAVASGVTVVVSSGDSGDTGTVSSPATDPLVIAAGATNTLRENAMAYGFTGWVNDDITPLSSGGTTPNNKLVDLVAPGYGGEAACNPKGSDCPTNTATEAFGGTSEAAPLIAGAAADVIQAYRDSHNGNLPAPALVKQLLTSTATDIDAPADQQGAGLVNIAAAVQAAQMTANSTLAKVADPSLITTPTQLDLTGRGGSTSNQTVSLYNADSAATTVTGTYRELGPETQIGSTVTEQVSAPASADPTTYPADGADAASAVQFTVPAGLDRLDADMIWPDATNSNVLNFILTDPSGNLRQISYDYGAAASKAGGIGSVPNIQHVEVANPPAGVWTAQIKWANGRAHLQSLPNVPGTYTGPVSFKVAGQNFTTSPASASVSIPSHGSATIPLSVAFPMTPGDHPESVQFVGANGAALSLPIARRTLIPSEGGPFNTVFSSSVGRGLGGIQTYDINVPAGDPDLGVTMETADASADNPYSFYLVNPSGTAVTHLVNGKATSAYTFAANAGGQGATAHIANPATGTWEIDVKLNLTTSGQEFQQTVFGDVLPQAPAITAPADGTTATTLTPTVSGTGVAGDTVTVSDATGDVICTATVLADGTWSCTTTPLTSGPVILTATQADSTGDPSSPSAPVTIIPPIQTTITLAASPSAPTAGQEVDLTATTIGVPDGTTVTFADGNTSVGTGTVASGTATLSLPTGLAVGDHMLTASVPATATTLAATSAPVDVMVSKSGTTISLTLAPGTVSYGTAVTGSIAVSGATGGTATVTYGSTTKSVAIGSDGTGTFTLPATLAVGQTTVTASYDGTATVAASGPVSASVTVTQEATTLGITPKSTDVKEGTPDTVLLSIGGYVGGNYPSGAVSVVATTASRSVTTKGTLLEHRRGKITLSVTLPSAVGTCTLKARFAGDANYSHSPAAITKITVYRP